MHKEVPNIGLGPAVLKLGSWTGALRVPERRGLVKYRTGALRTFSQPYRRRPLDDATILAGSRV